MRVSHVLRLQPSALMHQLARSVFMCVCVCASCRHGGNSECHTVKHFLAAMWSMAAALCCWRGPSRACSAIQRTAGACCRAVQRITSQGFVAYLVCLPPLPQLVGHAAHHTRLLCSICRSTLFPVHQSTVCLLFFVPTVLIAHAYAAPSGNYN